MAPRNEEQLQKLFRESRERNQKKLEKKMGLKPKSNVTIINERNTKYLEALSLAAKIKAIQASKMQEVDNVSINDEKTPHRALNVPKNAYEMNEVGETYLYNTRQELQESECDINEFGRIDWEKWDEITEITRKEINDKIKAQAI